MELKRVFNLRTILALLCLTCISCLLFYNQQIQNGIAEILQYDENYDQTSYNIFDVYAMYQDMEEQYRNGAWRGESRESGNAEFVKWYYAGYIGKDSPKRSVFMTAKEIFNENAVYAENYSEQIHTMRENAKNMLQLNVFSNKNSFAYHNILKTRYDLAGNEQVHTVVSNGKAVDSVYGYKMVGYSQIVFMMIVIYQFLGERKTGLWNLMFLAPNGRWKLALKRTGIIAFMSVISSCIFQTAIWIESFVLYGGIRELQFSIQSSETFAYVLLPVSRAEYLIISLLIMSFAAMGIGMLLWGIISIADTQIGAAALLLGITVLEYLCYMLISERSILNVLKYANIFQMAAPMDSLVQYVNCGIGTVLFTRLEMLVFIMGTALTAGTFLAFFAAQKKYPVRSFARLKTAADKLHIICNQWIAKLSPFGLEVYKFLVSQKGWIVILVLAVLVSKVSIYGGVSYDEEKSIMRDYYSVTGGNVVNETVLQETEKYQNHLNAMKQEQEELSRQIQTGESTQGARLDNLGKDIEIWENVVGNITRQINYLVELKAERGIAAEVISPYAYEGIFGGRTDYSINLINMYVFLALIFLMNTSFSYEQKGNMTVIIRSSKNGRSRFVVRKLAVQFLMTFLIWITVYGYYFYRICGIYKLNNPDCSILSIQNMEWFPCNISIRSYLILGAVIKFFVMWAVVLLLTLISLYFKYNVSMAVSLAFIVPHMLYLLGFSAFRYISVVLPMNDWQMWRVYPVTLMYVIYAAILLVGAAAGVMVFKKWRGSILI